MRQSVLSNLFFETFRFCASLIYYALSLNSGSLAGDLFLNTFLLGAVEVPAALLNMILLTKGLVGERRRNSRKSLSNIRSTLILH